MIGERPQQIAATPDERTARFERGVQPLVRIDGNRIGLCERAQALRGARNTCGERTVGAIDVEPGIVSTADRGDLMQRIDDTGTDGSCGADNQEGGEKDDADIGNWSTEKER